MGVTAHVVLKQDGHALEKIHPCVRSVITDSLKEPRHVMITTGTMVMGVTARVALKQDGLALVIRRSVRYVETVSSTELRLVMMGM